MPSIHQELRTRSIRTVKNGRKDMGIILLDVYIFVFFSHRRSVSCGSQAGAVIHATGARKKNQTLSPSTYAPLAPMLDTPTAKPCIFGAPPPLSRSQIWLPFNQNRVVGLCPRQPLQSRDCSSVQIPLQGPPGGIWVLVGLLDHRCSAKFSMALHLIMFLKLTFLYE